MTSKRLSEYEIHDVLRNERRTRLLEHLHQECDTVTLRGLSEHIAVLETGETPPPRRVRESVYNSCHQSHLPKLHRMGIVDYEPNRKLVRLGDTWTQVSPYMNPSTGSAMTWPVYNLLVGSVGMVVVTLSSLGVAFFATVPILGWVGLFLVVSIASALYQEYAPKWGDTIGS
jgi:hypothetical protein